MGLVQEDDLLEPFAEPTLGDLLPNLGRLAVVRLLLQDRKLLRLDLLGHVLFGDPARRQGCDVDRDLTRELEQLLVAGHEVRLAVDLDERSDAVVEVDVVGHDALRRLTLASLGGLGLPLDAQDLDRLVGVSLRLLAGRACTPSCRRPCARGVP